jgi:biopolymer transport protein ExbD
MAMSVGNESTSPMVMCDMNTTPLIDVMLVLLVMLIVTIPIQTHAVKIDLPVAPDARPAVDAPAIDLEIDFDGTPIWNGTPVPSRAQLDAYLSGVAAQRPQPEVHVRPHRLAKYDVVARTLADAQRLGVTRIGFVGNEQYIE